MPIFAPPKLWTPPRGIVRPRPGVLRPRRHSPRLRELTRWRRSIGAFNAGKLQRDPATGKIYRNPDTGKLPRGTDESNVCCCAGTSPLPELVPCFPGGATGLGLRPEDNADSVVFGQVVQYKGGCYSVGADATGLTPTDANATYLSEGCESAICLPCVACPPIDDVTVSAGQYTISLTTNLCTNCYGVGVPGSYPNSALMSGTFSGTFCVDFLYTLGVYLEGFCVWTATHTVSEAGRFYTVPGCTGDSYPYDTVTLELLRDTFFDGTFHWDLGVTLYASTAPDYGASGIAIFNGGVDTADPDCRTGFTMPDNAPTSGCDQSDPIDPDPIGYGGSASGSYGC